MASKVRAKMSLIDEEGSDQDPEADEPYYTPNDNQRVRRYPSE